MRQNGRAAPVAAHRLRPPARVHINRRFFGASVGAVRLNHDLTAVRAKPDRILKIPPFPVGRSSCALLFRPAVYRYPSAVLCLESGRFLIALTHWYLGSV